MISAINAHQECVFPPVACVGHSLTLFCTLHEAKPAEDILATLYAWTSLSKLALAPPVAPLSEDALYDKAQLWFNDAKAQLNDTQGREDFVEKLLPELETSRLNPAVLARVYKALLNEKLHAYRT